MINKIWYVNPILFLRSQDFRKACGLRGKEKIPSLINDLVIKVDFRYQRYISANLNMS